MFTEIFTHEVHLSSSYYIDLIYYLFSGDHLDAVLMDILKEIPLCCTAYTTCMSSREVYRWFKAIWCACIKPQQLKYFAKLQKKRRLALEGKSESGGQSNHAKRQKKTFGSIENQVTPLHATPYPDQIKLKQSEIHSLLVNAKVTLTYCSLSLSCYGCVCVRACVANLLYLYVQSFLTLYRDFCIYI